MFKLLILTAALSSPSPQQDAVVAAALAQVNAVRVGEGGLNVDGKLDEPAWQQAIPHTSFTQRDPNEGQRATEETEVRVMYDDISATLIMFWLFALPNVITAELRVFCAICIISIESCVRSKWTRSRS